jgi:predicted phage terminase large subunit-like protein
VFITAAGGIDGGHDEGTLRKLCKVMIEYGVREVRVEKNFADGMYAKHLARVMGTMGIKAGITPVVAKGQKEVRIIDTLEPAIGSHKIILHSKVARDQVLMSQITKLTRDRGSLIHDDRVDALEMCVSGFTDSMIIDTDKIIKDNEDEDFQNEIKGYLQIPTKRHQPILSLGKNKGKRKSWI